jgi:hypothetical protein
VLAAHHPDVGQTIIVFSSMENIEFELGQLQTSAP